MTEPVNPNSTLTQVLSYVDSPFKLAAIVVMGVLAFMGYWINSNQEFLLSAYDKKKSLPSMESSKFDDTSKMLIKNTGANLVAIYEIDMVLNTRKLTRLYTKDGRVKTLDGYVTTLLSNNDANNKDAISLMSGHVPCGEYTKPQSMLGIYYIEKGVTYTCRVSVPSNPNHFIGQITLGFEQKPSIEVEHFLKIAGDDLLQVK